MHITTWYDYDEKCIISITVMRWWHYTLKMNIYEIIAFIKIKEPTAKVLLPIGTNRREDNNNKKNTMHSSYGSEAWIFFYCLSWPSFEMAIFSYFTKAKYTFNDHLLCLWFSGGTNKKRRNISHTYSLCRMQSAEQRNRERETLLFLVVFVCYFYILTDFYCIGTILGMVSWVEYWHYNRNKIAHSVNDFKYRDAHDIVGNSFTHDKSLFLSLYVVF